MSWNLREFISIVNGLFGISLVVVILSYLVVRFISIDCIPLLGKINIVLIVIASWLIILGVRLMWMVREFTQDLRNKK